MRTRHVFDSHVTSYYFSKNCNKTNACIELQLLLIFELLAAVGAFQKFFNKIMSKNKR